MHLGRQERLWYAACKLQNQEGSEFRGLRNRVADGAPPSLSPVSEGKR